MRLVFGASGFVGSALLTRLHEEGYAVRAASRNLEGLRARGWPEACLAQADALVPETLEPVLRGVDIAYYLVHSMAAGRRFGALDETAARHFRAAAARAGVRRIVYLGGIVPGGARNEHLVSRARTGEILAAGPVPVTEIRAGIIVGPGSAAFEVMRDTVLHLPVVCVPRGAFERTTPIGLDDLLEYLVRVPELRATAGQTYDAGGPESLTYVEMMRQLADLAGHKRPWILPLPGISPRVFARFLGLVSAVPTPVARALIEGMRHDFTTDDDRLACLLPMRLQNVREAIATAFAAERAARASGRWLEGAFDMRDHRIDYAYYAKRASGSSDTRATPAAVWDVLRGLGGSNGYFYQDWMWRTREMMDWIVGGPGLKRGRSDPTELRVGDWIDSWQIIGVEPERRLTLAFKMKAPGSGVLEFELSPRSDGGTRLTATAYWHPAGIAGIAYWFAFDPFHKFLFEGMTRQICRHAESRETTEAPQGQ